MKMLLLVLASWMLTFNSPTGSVAGDNNTIHFTQADVLSDILDIAERENKLVLLDFTSDRCPPCRTMEKRVFTDRDVATYFNRNFISYKVNIAQKNGPALKKLYGVYALPTLICVTPQGRIITSKIGYTSKQGMMDMGRTAMNNRYF